MANPSKIDNKSISQMFGSIAAAQTLLKQMPFSFGMDENGITCSFDLLTALLEVISDRPLPDIIIEWFTQRLTDNDGYWMQWFEDTIKLGLLANITNLLTCEMNPFIPDRLIGGGQFLFNSDMPLNFSGEGITIPVSSIDFTGFLGICPADDSIAAKSSYMPCYDDEYHYATILKKKIPEGEEPVPCESVPSENIGKYIVIGETYYVWTRKPLGVKDLWKHDDFNAFLWYVKNKGMYSNLDERNKLMWDNRYKTHPSKYERKPESFFTKTNNAKDVDGHVMYTGENGIIPFDAAYLAAYNDNPENKYKKRQIMEVRYIDGDGIHSDSFQFRLAASSYYKTANFNWTTKKGKEVTFPMHNKPWYRFMYDLIMSIKLYDANTLLYQLLNNFTGQGGGATFNFSVTRETEVINEMIDSVIERILKTEDATDDSYFTFSNDDYTEMLINAEKKRNNGLISDEDAQNYSQIIDSINDVNGEEVIDNTSGKCVDVLSNVANSITSGNTSVDKWKFKWDYQFELIRMVAGPLIQPLFTPKVIALLLINTEIMGNPLKLGEKITNLEDIWVFIVPLIKNVVLQVKDVIIEFLYNHVIKNLTEILTIFSLKLMMEQLEYYRVLITDMINACIGASNRMRIGTLDTPFNQVDYVDIIGEEKE